MGVERVESLYCYLFQARRDAGLIVAEKDIAARALTIKQLLSNTDLRECLKRKGLERVKRFSVPVVADEYKEFYRWLSTQPCPNPAG